MKFTEHRDASLNIIRHYIPGKVTINQQEYHQSCIITQHQIINNWNITDIEQLNAEHLQALLAFKPEVLIIGTGETQIFPPAALFGLCAQAGVSLEVMNNAAACRTYNVLTTEDREVVLGLIL